MSLVSKIGFGPASESNQTRLSLRWKDADYPIERLDQFTFDVTSRELADAHDDGAGATVHVAQVRGVDEVVDVQFRVGSADDGQVLCRFFDLTISARDRLSKLAERSASPDADALQSLSYDELALGNTDKRGGSEEVPQNRSATVKKAIVSLALAASMLLVVGWVAMVVRSQSTISVSNSVMVGNYQPVSTPLEGRLLDLRVAIGDRVYLGQVLATVANPAVEHELGVVETQISRAQKDLAAYRREAVDIEAMLTVARETLKTKRLVALAVKLRIEGDLKAAKSQFKRLKRLLRNGHVGMADFEQAQALRDRWAAELESQNAVIAGIGISETAAANNVIVDDGRITNPISEIHTKIALAESLVGELSATRDLLATKAKPAELVAPSAGTVFAIYRRPGEVLKHAEEAIAISREGDTWATGHIPAATAANIKPGQSVEIEIPSFGITTTGIVDGIGHRAVHGRGGYTADFRGGPLDVPVRVALKGTAEDIPSGLRLNMTIRVRDHLKDLKGWMAGWSTQTVRRDVAPLPETPGSEPVSPERSVQVPAKADVNTSDAPTLGDLPVLLPAKKSDVMGSGVSLSPLDLALRRH